MSRENLDVMASGEVLTNQLSSSGRGDATATIENPTKWVTIVDEDLISKVNANDASIFILNQTKDPTSDEIDTAMIQQQNSLKQEVNGPDFFCISIFVTDIQESA